MQKVEMSSEKRWHTFLIDLHMFEEIPNVAFVDILLTIKFNSKYSNLLFLFHRRFQILRNL